MSDTHTTHHDTPEILYLGPGLAQWQSLRLVTSQQVLLGFESRSGHSILQEIDLSLTLSLALPLPPA